MATPSLEPTVVRASWRYRRLIALLVIVFAIAFIAVEVIPGEQYTASAALPLQPQQSLSIGSNSSTTSDSYVNDQIAILKSNDVSTATIAALQKQGYGKGLKAQDIASMASVSLSIDPNATTNSTSTVLQLSFKASDKKEAPLGLGDWVDAFNTVRAQQVQKTVQTGTATLTKQLQANAAQINETRTKLEQLPLNDPTTSALQTNLTGLYNNAVTIQGEIDQLKSDAAVLTAGTTLGTTVEGSTPTKGTLVRVGVFGGILGLVLGGIIAYLLANRRRRFETAGQPALVFGAPLLGEVIAGEDEIGTLPTVEPNRNSAADAFGVVAVAISVQARRDANVIVGVCAPRDSKVRPTVVANIALSLAQERQRVLLLDAAAGDGFPASEIVSRGISSEPLSRSATFTFPGGGVLTVLRYESSAANAETDELVADHEVVLLDIPRRLSGETALGLATVDRAVVVVEADSSIDSAELLASDLRSLGAHVIGYVYARPSEKKHKNNGNGKRSDGREGLNGSRRELGSGEPPA